MLVRNMLRSRPVHRREILGGLESSFVRVSPEVVLMVPHNDGPGLTDSFNQVVSIFVST